VEEAEELLLLAVLVPVEVEEVLGLRLWAAQPEVRPT
jgi:hypothetical protein